MDDKDKEIQKTKEYNYVLWSIIVILAIMLVNLFAQQTCNNEIFVNQVSFASTISSIILSVIAIIMTVVSNDSISSLLHKVRDLHDNIKDIPSDIKKTSNDLNNSVEQLNSLEDKLNKIPEKLEQTQETINHSIEKLICILDDVKIKVEGIDQKTDKFKEKLLSFPEVEKTDSVTLGLSKEFIESFIERLPLLPIVTIYICASASKNNKIIELHNLLSFIELKGFQEYVSTVIVIFRALELIEADQYIGVWKIISINKTVEALATKRMMEVRESIKDKIDLYWDCYTTKTEE